MELIIMGIFMGISFFVGYVIGRPKKEVVTKPVPIKKIKKNKNTDDFDLDESTIVMLENIEAYNGTSVGQKDVPEEE